VIAVALTIALWWVVADLIFFILWAWWFGRVKGTP